MKGGQLTNIQRRLLVQRQRLETAPLSFTGNKNLRSLWQDQLSKCDFHSNLP